MISFTRIQFISIKHVLRGNPISEQATIITRLAPTFLRLGSFEIIRGVDSETNLSGSSPGNYELGKKLLDFTIDSYYSYLKNNNFTEMYLFFILIMTI